MGNHADNSILEMFGLSYEQSLLMFSAQKLVAWNDAQLTKNEKKAELKKEWIKDWEKGIITSLNAICDEKNERLLTKRELQTRVKKELAKDNNRTWYYIAALEILEFVPYTALGGDHDKEYVKLNYDEKRGHEYAKTLLLEHKCLSEDKLDRLENTYTKSLSKIAGKTGKIAMKVLIVVAVGAVAAALAAIAAPGIAVAIVGGSFEGLGGIALSNACLAMIGGGAIAAGGTGIAGGTAIIAGGGALLGIAGGGAAVGLGTLLVETSPEYTLTQAAKLETILKEVILNAQQDVVCAQKIIEKYKEQIDEMNKKLTAMELEAEKNKKDLKSIKLSIKYLKKSCKNMSVFTSAYEEGMKAEG